MDIAYLVQYYNTEKVFCKIQVKFGISFEGKCKFILLLFRITIRYFPLEHVSKNEKKFVSDYFSLIIYCFAKVNLLW